MNPRYIKNIAALFFLMLVGCDHPAKKVKSDEIEFFSYSFSLGGIDYVRDRTLNFEDGSLSEKGSQEFTVRKESELYKFIHNFLNSHDQSIGVFKKISIPPRHVLLLYIRFKSLDDELIRLSLGKNWIVYYSKDFLGESAAVIYPVEEEEVLDFLTDLKI